MVLDSVGALPTGAASADMHAVSHPDPMPGARPGINGETCYPFLPLRPRITHCSSSAAEHSVNATGL